MINFLLILAGFVQAMPEGVFWEGGNSPFNLAVCLSDADNIALEKLTTAYFN
jgi:hypothetical protein